MGQVHGHPSGFAAVSQESPWSDPAANDLPGGVFQLGHSVDLSRSNIDVSGFVMQSLPDGSEYFIAEDFGPWHWSCCWSGRGPTYHVIEGNVLGDHSEELLQFQSRRSCCCLSADLDVVSLHTDEVFANADDHAACCFKVNTRVSVRDEERFRVLGSLAGACCSCLASEHRIVDGDRQVVGKVAHWSSGAHIEFPPGALTS